MTDSEQEHDGAGRRGTAVDTAVNAAAGDADIAMTVGEVSTLLGVSVRALHHWDETGLVHPSRRSAAGYRLYCEADIMRIQQVLVYRQTGMNLADIKMVLDEPETDAMTHLRRQRELVQGQVSHLQQMLNSIDMVMEIHQSGARISVAEMAEIWGTDWDPVYIEDAHAQWGDTEDWAESYRRKAQMSRADWERAHEETVALETALAEAMRSGVKPGSPEANALARWHRKDFNRWFEVSTSKQVLIARGYVADERYARYYDKRAPGLAAWLKDVIDASARSEGVDPATATWE
ncbi:MerR family transcriptional regulator [Actinomyces naeslundii]|nr:MerR family transcriptional regulator [Actinomyces naeslundii]EJN85870.1 putative transcriptional activator TipA [Actinomyces naeslundii str. Howell 279]QQC20096.1 MerR family transcriptional regulator [Actinomyces naeslundii]